MTSSANDFQQFKNCKVVVFLVHILIREKNIWVWLQWRCARVFFPLFSLLGIHTHLSALNYLYFKTPQSVFCLILSEPLLPPRLWELLQGV